jgi:hypothetical protein
LSIIQVNEKRKTLQSGLLDRRLEQTHDDDDDDDKKGNPFWLQFTYHRRIIVKIEKRKEIEKYIPLEPFERCDTKTELIHYQLLYLQQK